MLPETDAASSVSARVTDPAATTDELVRLGRLAYAECSGPSLTPTQWMVLRYLSRANRFSRTVSAFAEYHASTRGTASQTIKGLVQRGYLTRTRSDVDGRSVRLDLTARGRAALAADPCARLESVIAGLPTTELGILELQTRRLNASVSAATQRAAFGTCRRGCRHFEACATQGNPVCRLIGAELGPDELDSLCMEFAPA